MSTLKVGQKCYFLTQEDFDLLKEIEQYYDDLYYPDMMLNKINRVVKVIKIVDNKQVVVEFDNGCQWRTHPLFLYNRNHNHVTITHHKLVHCIKCGSMIEKPHAVQLKNKKYICNECLTEHGYYTKVQETKNRQVGKGLRYGFELECKPKDRQSHVEMSAMFVPTSDGSLANDYIEYKTPMYQSLIGIRHMFEKVEKLSTTHSSTCGSHINISHVDYNDNVAHYVRKFSQLIFTDLKRHMMINADNTKRVCGRYFTHYASNNAGYCEHTCFINLSHNDRIEFRISKFRSARQYFELTNMWGEVVLAIMDWYNHEDYNSKTAKKLGEKIKKIYIKYEAGNAKCQKRYHK